MRGVLLDLDGVLYDARGAVPGAARVVDWLARERIPYRFLTNTTSRPRQAIVDRLRGLGVSADADQVLTPPVAAVSWLAQRRVRHPALFVPEATAAEFEELDPLPATATAGAGAVVVGDLGDGWDFTTLNRAFRLLMEDERVPLVALGMTRFWRADDGLRLDTGPFVRALEHATGRAAVVLGKPDAAFYGAAVRSLGLEPHRVAMVGDDVRVDVGGARAAGLVGVLVRTGKFSAADLTGDASPDAVLDSVADLPRWWDATGADGPIAGVPTSVTAFVGRAPTGPVGEPTTVASLAEYERVFGGLWAGSALGYAVRDFFANGGATALVLRLEGDGAELTASDLLGAGAGSATGIHALERADGFNLLVVVPYAGGCAGLDAAVIASAAALCESRRAMLLLDPPSSWQGPSDIVVSDLASGDGTGSANAAVYFPRLRQPDPLRGGEVRDVAPSGAVAGVMARTDRRRGVWKAPAGVEATLSGFTGLSVDLGDRDLDLLNPLGVNCLRSLPASGLVVWGARTLQGADGASSEWTYVPVRRTALFLEESIDRGTRWAVFEPNDEPLWSRLRQRVEEFLHGLFRQGAFAGSKAEEAYLVRCGADTTTREDLDRGVVDVVVGFAPLRPAEFVVVRVRQRAGRSPAR